jgi:hypothetical protein
MWDFEKKGSGILMNGARTYSAALYIIIGICFLFILFSNPFLRLPFDPWDHLLRIVSLHDEGKCFYFWPGNACPERILWHEIWAQVFKIIGINDIFLWAKIIHVFQFILAGLVIFYFSKTVLKILINEKETTYLNFLSLFSTLLWFIGNGTFSEFQQAWIMWYSVTHQGLTIPLFWYITALTIKIFYENLTVKKGIFFIVQIAGASFLIAKTHPSELLYYLIILSILLLFNLIRMIRLKDRKANLISIAFIFLIMFVAVKYFNPEKAPLLSLISSDETFGQIMQKIKARGHEIVPSEDNIGLNRSDSTFSEIARISEFLAILTFTFYFLKYILKKRKDVNLNLFICLLVSSIVFYLFPSFPFMAGLAGYIVPESVVYRFFYASPWFIFLPLIVYEALPFLKKAFTALKMKEIEVPSFYKFAIIFITTGFTVFLLVIYLRQYYPYRTVRGNIISIVNSLNRKKVGVQYSEDDINSLGEKIKKCEQSNKGKTNIYYIREISFTTGGAGGKAYIIRGVFRKYVYVNRRYSVKDFFIAPLTKDSFFKLGLDKKYNLIDIDNYEQECKK